MSMSTMLSSVNKPIYCNKNMYKVCKQITIYRGVIKLLNVAYFDLYLLRRQLYEAREHLNHFFWANPLTNLTVEYVSTTARSILISWLLVEREIFYINRFPRLRNLLDRWTPIKVNSQC